MGRLIIQKLKGRFLGIFLLFSFVAPVATTFIILRYQKKQVRREVKWKMIAGIDKEELVFFKFTDAEKQNDLRWEHSKEFEYKGEMYDIVETQFRGDTTYYWCWWDYEETQLNKQLDGLLAFAYKKDNRTNKNQKILQAFYKSLYYSNSKIPFAFHSDQLNLNCPSQSILFNSHSHSPPVPPPELV